MGGREGRAVQSFEGKVVFIIWHLQPVAEAESLCMPTTSRRVLVPAFWSAPCLPRAVVSRNPGPAHPIVPSEDGGLEPKIGAPSTAIKLHARDGKRTDTSARLSQCRTGEEWLAKLNIHHNTRRASTTGWASRIDGVVFRLSAERGGTGKWAKPGN